MATSILEQISENIKTVVASAEAANRLGVSTHFTAVRPNRKQFAAAAWDDMTVLISRADAEKQPSDYGTIEWKQYFTLEAIVIDSDAATDSIDTRLNEVEANIVKKLLEDTGRGTGTDGRSLAINTRHETSVPYIDEQSAMSEILIRIMVQYRTKDNDPYTRM